MPSRTLGILGYQPNFMTSLSKLRESHQTSLEALIGQPLIECWVIWNLRAYEWFSDCPIVLCIGHRQLEVCVRKLDELSLTWNTIDLSQPVAWPGQSDLFQLEWRKDALPAFAPFVGRFLRGIKIIEYRYSTRVVADRAHPARAGTNVDGGWCLHGLEFAFESGVLTIANGLDTNEVLVDSLDGDDIRKTWLAS